MNERLRGIELKLDRAQQHLAHIQEWGMAWISKEKSWEFIPDINEGKRRYIVSIRLVEPMPPILPLLVDEIVHHLRSSLDHLASYMVERSGGQGGRAAWPVLTSRWKWEREVARRERQWQFWRKERGGPLAGARADVRAFVEGKQPYKCASHARYEPLVELTKLWNAYKHRILNPIHVYAAPSGTWSDLFHVSPEIEPVSFKWLIQPREELKLGAKRKLALLVFPSDRPLPRVEVKGHLPLEVIAGNPKSNGGSLHDDLALIREIVAEAIAAFPPRE